MFKYEGCLSALILAAALLGASPALAQTSVAPSAAADTGLEASIGKVVTADGLVTVEHKVAVVLQANASSGPAQAKVGDPVYQGDVMQTGADGKLVLTFKDGSVFNLSSNGRMALDELVYDPKSSANSTRFTLAKGTLTFASGQIAKSGDMRVDTPVGTMGIRGTTPHVQIMNDGSVKFSTLVEEKKNVVAPASSRGNQQPKVRPAGQGQAKRAAATMSPEQSATYNKVLNIDYKICGRC
jgi:hypothetical protein